MKSVIVFIFFHALLSQNQAIGQTLPFNFREECDSSVITALITKSKGINNIDSSISILKSVLFKAKKCGYKSLEIRIHSLIGWRYLLEAKYNESNKSFFNAIQRIEKVDSYATRQYSFLYGKIAYNHFNLGNFDSCITTYHIALDYQERYGTITPSKYYLHSEYAGILASLNLYQEAINVINSINRKIEKDSSPHFLAFHFHNAGFVYRLLDTKQNYDTAYEYISKAYDISTKDSVGLQLKSDILNAFGDICINSNKLDEALVYFTEASVNNQNITSKISSVSGIGYCYYLKKDYTKAVYYFEKVIKEYGDIEHVNLLPPLLNLAKSYAAKGNFKKSSLYFEKYYSLFEKTKGRVTHNKISKLHAQFYNSIKEKEILKTELKSTNQKIALQKINSIAYVTIALIFTLISIAILYLRYSRKIEKQKEKQLLEVATWRSSLEGEEKERKRLAKELHDNIGGNLSTLKTWLGNINNSDKSLLQIKEDMLDVNALVETTLKDVRNTAHHLMPELLLRLGLAEAIRLYCLNIQKASNIDFQFHYFGYIGNLGKELELIIYRIIQELVQNIVKHAEASRALVQMSLHEQKLNITIEDNGKGFDYENTFQIQTMGLRSIADSITHLKGSFIVNTAAGAGTTIEIELHPEQFFTPKH